MKPHETTRYSEAFKQQVVAEVAAGKFRGLHAAAKGYGIGGATTVQSWLRRYGRADLMPRQITITTMKEQDEKKALKERVRQLERALADSHMRGLLDEEYLKIACRRMGVEVDDFKKARHQALAGVWDRTDVKAVTLSGRWRIARISRQGFYRGRRERRRRQLDAEGMVTAVQQERRSQPRLGTRKLQIRLAQAGLAVGRDALFAVLRDRGLLVTPKRKQVRTTYHDPNLPVYRNLLYQLEPTQVHQVWVSDITCVSTDEGWLYLSLIADKISHPIVGWHAGETLEAGESVKALDRAIAQLPANR